MANPGRRFRDSKGYTSYEYWPLPFSANFKPWWARQTFWNRIGYVAAFGQLIILTPVALLIICFAALWVWQNLFGL